MPCIFSEGTQDLALKPRSALVSGKKHKLNVLSLTGRGSMLINLEPMATLLLAL